MIFRKISHLKMLRFPKNSKFRAAQMVKMAVFRHQNDQNGFHIKSDWFNIQKSFKLVNVSQCNKNTIGKLTLLAIFEKVGYFQPFSFTGWFSLSDQQRSFQIRVFGFVVVVWMGGKRFNGLFPVCPHNHHFI